MRECAVNFLFFLTHSRNVLFYGLALLTARSLTGICLKLSVPKKNRCVIFFYIYYSLKSLVIIITIRRFLNRKKNTSQMHYSSI